MQGDRKETKEKEEINATYENCASLLNFSLLMLVPNLPVLIYLKESLFSFYSSFWVKFSFVIFVIDGA